MRTKVNDKPTNISKTVSFENEAANIAIKSIEKELTEKNLKLKQKENSFQQQTESLIAKSVHCICLLIWQSVLVHI